MSSGRKRVLFIAEAVTLAHVARPLALAARLDAQEFEIEMACAPRYREFFPTALARVHEIHSVSVEDFLSRLAHGRPLYDLATLRRYVNDDLRLLERVRPAVVVGDFRLSLAVSARLLQVPYLMLANAYWSPYARPKFELPSLSLARFFGRGIASPIFSLLRPLAFAYHALPMNRLRREYGFGNLGFDLRRVYTEADHVAYADIPEVIPTRERPRHHSYIGPVLWSPPVGLPPWWKDIDRQAPLIYVTLGSSGDTALLPMVIEALADLPASIAVASAGARLPGRLPPNVHCAHYLPGERMARRARIVVCNGGSPTTQQALAEGVPVLGIPGNMDQFLNMGFIAARAAGAWLAADALSTAGLRKLAGRILGEESFHAAARAVAQEMRAYDAPARFAAILRSMS